MRLEISAKDFDRVLLPLAAFPGEVARALRRSLTRTGNNLATNISRQIRQESFLNAGDVRQALSKPLMSGGTDSMQVEVRVASRRLALDHFKLVPRRVTARKRLRSSGWPAAGFQIGPHEPVRFLPAGSGKGRPFVTRFSAGGRLFMMQRQGRKLVRVFGYSVQYFAAFDATVRAVERNTKDFFERRLTHEVAYLVSKLK